MSENRRQLVLDALNNRETKRVPVGFWFHFAKGDEVYQGIAKPEIVRKNIDGHRAFYSAFKPDFVKLMSDGFFAYPNASITCAVSASELGSIKPIGKEHPWITKQVELVKALTASFGSDVLTFYNIFGPATTLRLLLGDGEKGNRILADFIEENPKAVSHALGVIAEDLASLADRVIREGGADGIYLSVQNVQDRRVTNAVYRAIVAPSERTVLRVANRASENNILHICGYEGSRNDLTLYADYDAKAINWAVTVEGVGLNEGKRLFGGKAVIGGFANGAGSLLHAGSEADIRAFTKGLLSDTGKKGVIIGADCTVPPDIGLERLEWVRKAAGE